MPEEIITVTVYYKRVKDVDFILTKILDFVEEVNPDLKVKIVVETTKDPRCEV